MGKATHLLVLEKGEGSRPGSAKTGAAASLCTVNGGRDELESRLGARLRHGSA